MFHKEVGIETLPVQTIDIWLTVHSDWKIRTKTFKWCTPLLKKHRSIKQKMKTSGRFKWTEYGNGILTGLHTRVIMCPYQVGWLKGSRFTAINLVSNVQQNCTSNLKETPVISYTTINCFPKPYLNREIWPHWIVTVCLSSTGKIGGLDLGHRSCQNVSLWLSRSSESTEKVEAK